MIRERQLARLVKDSAQRRYKHVHWALQAGELVRLRRGRTCWPAGGARGQAILSP